LKRVVRAVGTEVIAAGADDVAVCVKAGDKLTIGTPLFG
jgi:hypothetical protein